MTRRLLAVALVAFALALPQQVRADNWGQSSYGYFSGGGFDFGAIDWDKVREHFQELIDKIKVELQDHDYQLPNYDFPDHQDDGPRVGVPEPGSMLLVGTGLLGMFAVARRREDDD